MASATELRITIDSRYVCPTTGGAATASQASDILLAVRLTDLPRHMTLKVTVGGAEGAGGTTEV